jgi:hypothetical protein
LLRKSKSNADIHSQSQKHLDKSSSYLCHKEEELTMTRLQKPPLTHRQLERHEYRHIPHRLSY